MILICDITEQLQHEDDAYSHGHMQGYMDIHLHKPTRRGVPNPRGPRRGEQKVTRVAQQGTAS